MIFKSFSSIYYQFLDGQAAISVIKTAFEVVAINAKLKWLDKF
jgi:hypothetical protein